VSCVKTAEPIEMLFWVWTCIGPRKRVWWVHIGAIWRIRLNRPCAAVMQSFSQITLSTLVICYHVVCEHSDGNGCVVLWQRVTLWLLNTDVAVLHMSTTQQCLSCIHQAIVSRSGTSCTPVPSAAWQCTWRLTAQHGAECGRDRLRTAELASLDAGFREKFSSVQTALHSLRYRYFSVARLP